MAGLALAGDTSGQIALNAPAVAGTTTLTLPATTGNVLADTTCGVCRAWVNFNGTGTVAIRASFNVTSITDNGTGNYTINFTTAMADANYVTSGASSTSSGSNPVIIRAPTTPTISTASIETIQGNGSNQDPAQVTLAFFR